MPFIAANQDLQERLDRRQPEKGKDKVEFEATVFELLSGYIVPSNWNRQCNVRKSGRREPADAAVSRMASPPVQHELMYRPPRWFTVGTDSNGIS
jgi:hypothetical protein